VAVLAHGHATAADRAASLIHADDRLRSMIDTTDRALALVGAADKLPGE
jgi:hypothetical protein